MNLEFVEKLKGIDFPKLTKFLDNLQLDENGNLTVLVMIDENNVHDISLNYTHHPSTANVDRLEQIKEDARKLKDNLVQKPDCQHQMSRHRVELFLNLLLHLTFIIKLILQNVWNIDRNLQIYIVLTMYMVF